MKVLELVGKQKLEWAEHDIPQPGYGEVQVKLEYVGICGSDLHFYEDGQLGNWIPDGPLVLGHEPGGTVTKVGEGVEDIKVGDRVALEPGVPCGKCQYCRKGRYNLCENISFMAIPNERAGVFSEYCVHPANMTYKLPDNMSTLEGAMIEPFAVGLHAVDTSGAKLGQTAAILGSGCIGLTTMLALKASGVHEIYMIDVLDKRLEKAKELGATKIINSKEEDAVEFIKSLPGGGVDLVFETAGNPVTTLQTSKLVKKGGVVTIVGMAATPELTFDMGSLMDKEAYLFTVFRYHNLYPTAIAAVKSGTVPLKSIVSHEFDFKDAIDAIAYNVNNKQDVIKGVIRF